MGHSRLEGDSMRQGLRLNDNAIVSSEVGGGRGGGVGDWGWGGRRCLRALFAVPGRVNTRQIGRGAQDLDADAAWLPIPVTSKFSLHRTNCG